MDKLSGEGRLESAKSPTAKRSTVNILRSTRSTVSRPPSLPSGMPVSQPNFSCSQQYASASSAKPGNENNLLLNSKISMKKCCVVPSCDAYDVETFCFPRNLKGRKMWCDALDLDPSTIGIYSRICHRHFSADQLRKKCSRKVLVTGAVPQFIRPVDEVKVERNAQTTPETTVHLTRKRKQKLEKEKLEPSLESLIICENKKRKKKQPRPKTNRPVKLVYDTPDLDQSRLIDRDYYYVVSHKHDKNIVKQSDRKYTASVYDDIRAEDKSKTVRTSMSENTNDADKSLLQNEYTSINDLLNEAMMSTAEDDSKACQSRDHKKFEIPDCISVHCRQLAARVFLLRREKERLTKTLELYHREVELLEKRRQNEKSAAVDVEGCASCADGRLEEFYKANLARAQMLRKQLGLKAVDETKVDVTTE